MEIDSTVSKQTTILIDLHFPFFFFFFGRSDSLCPLVSIDHPPVCIAPHVFSFIKKITGFLTILPIPWV